MFVLWFPPSLLPEEVSREIPQTFFINKLREKHENVIFSLRFSKIRTILIHDGFFHPVLTVRFMSLEFYESYAYLGYSGELVEKEWCQSWNSLAELEGGYLILSGFTCAGTGRRRAQTGGSGRICLAAPVRWAAETVKSQICAWRFHPMASLRREVVRQGYDKIPGGDRGGA